MEDVYNIIDNKNRKDATKNFPTICTENAVKQFSPSIFIWIMTLYENNWKQLNDYPNETGQTIDIDTIPTLLTFLLKTHD